MTVELVASWYYKNQWDMFHKNIDLLLSLIHKENNTINIIKLLNSILSYFGLYFEGLNLLMLDKERLINNLIHSNNIKREQRDMIITALIKRLIFLQLQSAYEALRLTMINIALKFPNDFDASVVTIWFKLLVVS